MNSSPEFILIAFTATILGGYIKGLSGFGYALISTSLLASFYSPQKAVTFLIIPLIAIEITLIHQLTVKEAKTCLNNYETYTTTLAIGTITGFYIITAIPQTTIKTLLGILTLTFTLSRTQKNPTHLQKLKQKYLKKSNKTQAILGLTSGIIFGSTNIGIQIVTYLKTMKLPRRKFIGLLALTLIPISALRLPLALQNTPIQLVIYSALAAPLGIIATTLGEKTGKHLDQQKIQYITTILLTIISLKLIRSGLTEL